MKGNKEDDVKVLLKKDGKYYSLEVKDGIDPEWARQKRLIIFNLFKDQHNLREVNIKEIGKL